MVEVVTAATTAAGERHEHLAGHEGKIAVRSWQGAIDGIAPFDDPSELSGVGWILAENWMPYQLISFVTPPFAGYVSGHSTYSRTAAEVLTLLTGDEFFPGGMFEYHFEQGQRLGLRVRSDGADVAAMGDVLRCLRSGIAFADLRRHSPARRRLPRPPHRP